MREPTVAQNNVPVKYIVKHSSFMDLGREELDAAVHPTRPGIGEQDRDVGDHHRRKVGR
ncbi:hypothetical protein [Gemmata sp. SH-PL17]|uniref:hypothetical protein n=1 Tax=Gemmata sp. SH-PL17 TaxID=1630693 RepID=UPI0012FA2DF1|nr:hypothetical protein [Gemmata sp. SH-PL17]